MPRIRSVHPDLCDDETMAGVSAYAERTFVRLWTHLDDDGRGPDNAKLWKGKLYPLHDDVTSERVERDLSELAACGLIIRYEVDGKRLLSAKPHQWKRWQKPNRPTESKLPPVPLSEDSVRAPSVVEGSVIGEGGESEGRTAPLSLIHSRENPVSVGLAARALAVPTRNKPAVGES